MNSITVSNHIIKGVLATLICLPMICIAAEKEGPVANNSQQLISDLESPDKKVKASVIEKLANKNEVSVAPKIMESVNDSDSRVRNMAIRAMGKMRYKNAVPVITQRLQDRKEDWRTRQDAAKALAQISDPTSVTSITEYLREVCALPNDTVLKPSSGKSYGTDKEFLASQITVHALLELTKKYPASSLSLIGAMKQEKEMTTFKFFLAQALGQLGNKEAVPVLMEYLSKSPNGRFRVRAAGLLGDLGDKKAVDALKGALADNYVPVYNGDIKGRTSGYEVRLAAYKSLLQLGVKVEKKGDEYILK